MLVHRLFHPQEVQLFQASGELQRLEARIVVKRVQHQGHVGAERFADSGARLEVPTHAGRAWQRRLPGVELERGIAARTAGQRVIRIGLRCIQATRKIVADHRARVGGYRVAGGTQQAVHRLAQDLAGQVPQREVDRGQNAVADGAQVQSLAFVECAPQVLAIERVLAAQHRRDDVVDDVRVDGAEEDTARTIVSSDGEHRLRRLVGLARMAVAVSVADDARGIAEALDGNVSDAQQRFVLELTP